MPAPKRKKGPARWVTVAGTVVATAGFFAAVAATPFPNHASAQQTGDDRSNQTTVQQNVQQSGPQVVPTPPPLPGDAGSNLVAPDNSQPVQAPPPPVITRGS